MNLSRRALYGFLLLIFTLVWFGNLQYRHLLKADEGRYAEISREMVASGDWLTPRLNGIKYFEKPPLQYWTTAAAFKAFGEHEWTARLWTALTGWLGVLLAFFTARRLWGEEAGLYAALVLGSSALYVMVGHVNALDMGLTFFMALALSGFLLSQSRADDVPYRRHWMLVAWAGAALAVLSKGLIGLVLAGAVLVIYSLWARDLGIWKRLHLLPGMALFLLITAPWFVAVSLANPEFARFFFVHEHFERFLTKVHGRYQPWYEFFPILLGGLLPWMIALFPALTRGWAGDCGQKKFRARHFLLVWSAVIFVFFSASSSKLPAYILPIFPALALLMGDYLTKAPLRSLARQHALLLGLGGALIGVAAFKYQSWLADNASGHLHEAYAPWLLAAAAVWLLGTAAAMIQAWSHRRLASMLSLAAGGLFAAQIAVTGHETLSPANSGYHFAQKVQPHLKPESTLYCLEMYDQTLPFYLKRTCTLVAHQDELAFGLALEPDKWIADRAAFLASLANMSGRRDAIVIMQPDIYDQLRAQGVPLRLLARDTRRAAATPE
jgi:4-amino-4-deoxy-L-arabinose transferase-like glycosyltransferase